MNKYYFAYGSNMNAYQMFYRCPGARPIGRAVLPNWRLKWCSVLTIKPRRGSNVHGVLWIITPDDEAALDRYEGVRSGFYYKDVVTVYDDAGDSYDAMVYIMTPERAAVELFPTTWYLLTCLEGAAQFKIHPYHLIKTLPKPLDIDVSSSYTKKRKKGVR